MTDTPTPRPWSRRLVYFATLLLVAALTAGVTALLINIFQRKQEAREHFFKLVELTEDSDLTDWQRNFPRQYDGYKRTVDTERTKHGGSDAINKLEHDPRLKRIYAGYAFSLDFREERGHAYMLIDQDNTERVKRRLQPGACLHCHSSVLPAYRRLGKNDEGKDPIQVGFQKVCAMDWKEARKLVEHPVTCNDCHDPQTTQLRVTRPGFLNGIEELAHHLADTFDPEEKEKKIYKPLLPHLTSLEKYRKDNRAIPREKRRPYKVNEQATRQEMRSFVCGQCHVEYYFRKKDNLLIYPWANGLKMDQIEDYYRDRDFSDWTHQESGAGLLKAQHPEFEMWNQGIHARSGVSCADCHMPYKREGAIKISDHHVRSPLLNVARACQVCHRYDEKEILGRAEAIQDRTLKLLDRAENAVVDLIGALKAGKTKLPAGVVEEARRLHRQAQWRLDFVMSENSLGFHAPQECARILAEAIDYARQGQVKLLAPPAK